MIILSIGTNIGDRERNIENAIMELGKIGKVTAVSPIYASEPWGFKSENVFYNIALTLESELLPVDLLRETQRIERELGRKTKTTTEYADRVIDIDIIDYDNQVIEYRVQNTNKSFPLTLKPSLLTLPHPLMHLRNFVLYPLADIAPEWRHPILKISAIELKKTTKDTTIPNKLT